jgi:type I restriction enzyme S subunit
MTRLRFLVAPSDERRGAGADGDELLSVSIHRGVVPRSAETEDLPRAEDLGNYKVVREGYVVLNRMRAFQGAVGRAVHNGIVSPDYTVLRPGLDVDTRYLHHLFRSSWFVGEMVARLRGIGSTETGSVRTPRINWEDLGDIDVAAPSVTEQRAIADYLDAETTRIDALIAKKQQLIHLLDERVNSLVFRGVSGRLTSADAPTRDSGLDWLGQIPTHFGTPTIGANFTTQLGKMLNAEAAAGPDQQRYVKNTNVKWDSFDLRNLPTMSFDGGDRTRCELRAGDLLVCEGGEVGRSAIWPGFDEPIYFQKALHRVRPLRDGNTRFLMYCLWAAASLDVFSVGGNQATIVHLTGEKLREHRFPWPPNSEQEEIVRQIDRGRRKISALKQRAEAQLDLLAEHRQALITAAVTGELTVAGAA